MRYILVLLMMCMLSGYWDTLLYAACSDQEICASLGKLNSLNRIRWTIVFLAWCYFTKMYAILLSSLEAHSGLARCWQCTCLLEAGHLGKQSLQKPTEMRPPQKHDSQICLWHGSTLLIEEHPEHDIQKHAWPMRKSPRQPIYETLEDLEN